MQASKIRNMAFLAITALSFLSLSGCGLTLSQKQAVGNFASVTLAVGNAASSELSGMRREVISMNVQRIQLVGEKKDAPGLDDLDEAFTIDATLVRQRAIEALVSYGNLLKTLGETDQSEAIRQSSDALIASFNDLPEFYRKIDQETVDAVGHALRSIGGFWVEWKKAKAVRSVVNSTGDQIVRLCSLLKDDFDPDADGKLASQFLNTTERLYIGADEVMEKARSFEERSAATAAIQKALENRDRREKIVRPLSLSIGSLQSANRELVTAVNSVKYSEADIDALQKNVRSLKSAIKVLADN